MVKRCAVTAEDRGRVYRLLSNLYLKPPSLELLGSLLKLAASCDEASPGEGLIDQIRLALKGISETIAAGAPQELQAKISAEFTRLFRGIRKYDSPPPPYESVYRQGVPFGGIAYEVLKEYERFGLGIGEEFANEPPDHIGFELSFMDHLCRAEFDARSRGDLARALELLRAEEAFLKQHLMSWVGELCNEIRLRDRTGFYRAVADLTEGWIKLDANRVSALIRQLEYLDGLPKAEGMP